jgi:hypothetical protein
MIMLVAVSSVAIANAQTERRTSILPPEMDPNYQSESEKIEAASRDLKNMDIRRVKERLPASVQSMYRKPSKTELEILSPSKASTEEYAEFLKQPHTGILKLNADFRCAQNTEVVSADENCSKYKLIPGGGTAYSFRFNSHRILRLSDLILQKNVLRTEGILQQGIMVDLGDIPIRDVNAATPGLKFLVMFEPSNKKSDTEKLSRLLNNGIWSDGFLYRLSFYAKINRTFALRSVAFEGNYLRVYDGAAYDELVFDKRKDVLVVFRIVDIDLDGNTTIVWKELGRHDVPSLKD